MTVKQAAERLEVSAATIYALVAGGRLKCHRIGLGRGTIRIAEEHVAAFLAGAEPAPPPSSAKAARLRLKHITVR